MRLTQHTDFAFRVLIYLGVREGELATISEIADHYDASRNHLMKVVHRLARNGYVTTVRGKNGGIRLGLPPERVNLGAVARCTEEDFVMAACFNKGESGCRLAPECHLQGILGEALSAFLGVLDAYTLEDLLANRQRLAELLDVKPVHVPALDG